MARAVGAAAPPSDWDRILSERETTAAALSAGLQRLAFLEGEVEELVRERRAVDSRRQGELSGLRARVRNLARPALATMTTWAGFGPGSASNEAEASAGGIAAAAASIDPSPAAS